MQKLSAPMKNVRASNAVSPRPLRARCACYGGWSPIPTPESPSASGGSAAARPMRFSEMPDDKVRRVLQGARLDIHEKRSVESAAQALASSLYEALPDSIVLARVFVTVPHGECPASIRAAVAGVEGIDALTPLLVLLGTRGRRPEWNSRHQSRGHAAIPLISARARGRDPHDLPPPVRARRRRRR